MTLVFIAVGLYLLVGLYVSRWRWRKKTLLMPDDNLRAALMVFFWPFALLLMLVFTPIRAFARWFYNA